VEVVQQSKVCKDKHLDPKHELSEDRGTLKDILKRDNKNNDIGFMMMVFSFFFIMLNGLSLWKGVE